ncbi:MAG: hypothetical protein M0Q90_04190 [Bacteroidales bacterium]|nr:hypothetical protein [Bacteroidales bacterium]
MKNLKLIKMTQDSLNHIKGGDQGGGGSTPACSCSCDCGDPGSIHDQTQSNRQSAGITGPKNNLEY